MQHLYHRLGFILLFSVFASFLSRAYSAGPPTQRSPPLPPRLAAAREIHAEALRFAHAGNYFQALYRFRTACKLLPRNAQVLNDLGVTEMRMGRYDAALDYLTQALAADTSFELTHKNLDELRRVMGLSQNAENVRFYVDSYVDNYLNKVLAIQAYMYNRSSNQNQDESKASNYRDGRMPFQEHTLTSPRYIPADEHIFSSRLKPLGSISEGIDLGHNDCVDNRVGVILDSNISPEKLKRLKALYQCNASSTSSGGSADSSIPEILSAPFVVRGAGFAWGWNPIFDIFRDHESLLRHVYGAEASSTHPRAAEDPVVDFYPNNMRKSSVAPILMSLKDALKYMITLPDTVFERDDIDVCSGGASYIQWNAGETFWPPHKLSSGKKNTGDVMIPSFLDDTDWIQGACFPSKIRSSAKKTVAHRFLIKTHWKMILIGDAGSGMFNHIDRLRTGSWQMQLAGRKLWHLCAPSAHQSRSLYDDGAGASPIDAFGPPDYDKYPMYREANCTQVVVEKGDFIYYPAGYWHQTRNLDDWSISMSQSVVFGVENARAVAQTLLQDCRAAPFNRNPPPFPIGSSNGRSSMREEDESALERLLDSEENPLGPAIDLDSVEAGGQRFLPSRRVCAYVERCGGIWENIFGGGDPAPSSEREALGSGNGEL